MVLDTQLLDPKDNPECDNCGNLLDPEFDDVCCNHCGAPHPGWKASQPLTKKDLTEMRKPKRLSVGPGEERGPVVDLLGALSGKPLPPGTKVPRVLPKTDEVPF
jgi:hypothetical protein